MSPYGLPGIDCIPIRTGGIPTLTFNLAKTRRQRGKKNLQLPCLLRESKLVALVFFHTSFFYVSLHPDPDWIWIPEGKKGTSKKIGNITF
jgi:hypothetical protein